MKDLRDANSKWITATFVSVDLTSLNEHLVCLKCKQIVVPLDDDNDNEVNKSIFICNACNSRVHETQCKSAGKVIFSAQTQKMKVTVNAEPAFVVTVFTVPITEKFKLVRSMIKSYVKIKHSVQILNLKIINWKSRMKNCYLKFVCARYFLFL